MDTDIGVPCIERFSLLQHPGHLSAVEFGQFRFRPIFFRVWPLRLGVEFGLEQNSRKNGKREEEKEKYTEWKQKSGTVNIVRFCVKASPAEGRRRGCRDKKKRNGTKKKGKRDKISKLLLEQNKNAFGTKKTQTGQKKTKDSLKNHVRKKGPKRGGKGQVRAGWGLEGVGGPGGGPKGGGPNGGGGLCGGQNFALFFFLSRPSFCFFFFSDFRGLSWN